MIWTLDNGALAAKLSTDGSDWTGSCNFAYDADKLNVTFNTNLEEQSAVKVRVVLDEAAYEGVAGKAIEIPVRDKAKIIPIVYLIYDNGGVIEGQGYVISFNRMASDAPAAVESYLPAPGQFVNTEAWQNAEKTLSNTAAVTLGAFGGSIVYKYDEPLKTIRKIPTVSTLSFTATALPILMALLQAAQLSLRRLWCQKTAILGMSWRAVSITPQALSMTTK